MGNQIDRADSSSFNTVAVRRRKWSLRGSACRIVRRELIE